MKPRTPLTAALGSMRAMAVMLVALVVFFRRRGWL